MNAERTSHRNFAKYFNFWNLVKYGSMLLLLVFLVYPFFSVIFHSFLSSDGKFTFEFYKIFFTKQYYYRTLWNSLATSGISTVFAIIIGVPLAYITSRFNVYWKKCINMLIIMSLMSPPFIGAYSWIMLLGRNGLFTNALAKIGIITPPIYGFGGIVLVFTLKFFPYVYLYVSGAMSSIDRSLEEAAENLGSSKLRRVMTITMPVIMPTLAAGAIMAFMSSLADFGTPMLIGEGYKVLPVLVYEEYMSEMGGNANMAGALSVVIICCSTAVLLIQKYVVARKNYVMTALRPPIVEELSRGKRILLTALCMFVASVAFLPQIVVIFTSFIKTNGPIFVQGFSLESYEKIFYKLSKNITNTFMFSFIAIIIIIIFGMLLSYLVVKKKSKISSTLDLLLMFPYVIPGAVLGISMLVAFNKPPLMLSGTAVIMIIAYVIRKMPYTIRSSSALLYQIDPSIEEASINLGVSPMRTFFKITARMMAPGVLSGAILSWITTINELSSSIMLYSGKTATISVAIYTEVVRSSFGTAAALASILTVATILSLLLFNWVSKGRVSVV
ncbi:ABC transporter permease [Caproiciproducens sp. R1]|jgi:ABC-type Fe3+ transport system, permease component|uniref:ABC transporter permease n=1 Tax=Caproiciproducens sp. R1 TaxID=3435000 RepID=UPI00056F006D|nr:iron ABC transporter permease [Oscillospiraceae bacterium]